MSISDSADILLAKELDKDKLIVGKEGYLFPVEAALKSLDYCDNQHLLSDKIYHSPYAIYKGNNPIGYMEISDYFEKVKTVYACYALLERYRGNGYATKVLKEVSDLILSDVLNDVFQVTLTIDLNNEKSKAVAIRAGFVSDGVPDKIQRENGYAQYVKKKKQ